MTIDYKSRLDSLLEYFLKPAKTQVSADSVLTAFAKELKGYYSSELTDFYNGLTEDVASGTISVKRAQKYWDVFSTAAVNELGLLYNSIRNELLATKPESAPVSSKPAITEYSEPSKVGNVLDAVAAPILKLTDYLGNLLAKHPIAGATCILTGYVGISGCLEKPAQTQQIINNTNMTPQNATINNISSIGANITDLTERIYPIIPQETPTITNDILGKVPFLGGNSSIWTTWLLNSKPNSSIIDEQTSELLKTYLMKTGVKSDKIDALVSGANISAILNYPTNLTHLNPNSDDLLLIAGFDSVKKTTIGGVDVITLPWVDATQSNLSGYPDVLKKCNIDASKIPDLWAIKLIPAKDASNLTSLHDLAKYLENTTASDLFPQQNPQALTAAVLVKQANGVLMSSTNNLVFGENSEDVSCVSSMLTDIPGGGTKGAGGGSSPGITGGDTDTGSGGV